MSEHEQLLAEIKTLPREELIDLFEGILQFLEEKRQSKSEGILSRLAQIQIDDPTDFSENEE